MVSQFLRLTKFEQLKIVESNFEIMKIGKEYLLGEDEVDDEKFLNSSIEIIDDVIMINHHDDEDYEMSIEDDDEHGIKRESFSDDDIKVKEKIADKESRQVSPKEIVDVLNFILSELNMQVS